MKPIKIAGQKFDILTPVEAKHETKDCVHIWIPLKKEVVVNPAREFVRGYGSQFVTVDVSEGRICRVCGLFEPSSELANAINTGEFNRILKQRNKKRKTICELLRELHEELTDQAQIDKVSVCLLIAKKMNDKLTQYVGVNRLAEWYDEDGNFIK